MSNLRYRADIDGLRSIAVVPVVLFHLGLGWMPGGFVGVDVFFVISGYLITTIISREIQSGEFSIARFYERRSRRIFPALFFMIFVTCLLASLYLMPTDLKEAAISASAAALFVSNILFYLQTGYFDAAAFTKPLLHTWSLAIEEQFYIFMPVILIVLHRLGMSFLVWVGLLTALSLGLSITTTEIMPDEAYYLLPWRAWELGIGALLALEAGRTAEHTGPPPGISAGISAARRFADHALVREGSALLGLGMILIAAFTLDKSTPFPGAAALLPCVGAALLIHSGRDRLTYVGRLLSMRGPVWIGKLSYSFYLWHWPVIVGFVYWKLDMPDAGEAVFLFCLALLLAWLSWYFVEQPFRKPADPARARESRRGIFLASGVIIGVLVGAGVFIHQNDGFPGRLTAEAQRLASYEDNRHPRFQSCVRQKNIDRTWTEPCLYGADTKDAPTVALWGDSHAGALIPAVEEAARQAGKRAALYSRPGCPPIADLEVYARGEEAKCAAFYDDTLEQIVDSDRIDSVILVLRPAQYVHGWTKYGFGERGWRDFAIGDRQEKIDPADYRRFMMAGLEKTIRTLIGAGKSVSLTYPVPEIGNSVPKSLAMYALRGSDLEDLRISRAAFLERNGQLIEEYDAIVSRNGIEAISIHEDLCRDGDCLAIQGDIPAYVDTNHLSYDYARSIHDKFGAPFE